jgi:hypothetical protein
MVIYEKARFKKSNLQAFSELFSTEKVVSLLHDF